MNALLRRLDLAWLGVGCWLWLAAPSSAQTLINIDFGAGRASPKTGGAGAVQTTNDYWNLYRHYDPKYTAGMPLVADGRLENLRLADGGESRIALTVSNAPGVWGNASGDPMYDSYIFARNGSNVAASLHNLPAGSYYFYLYGHADPDVTGEQNSVFTIRIGTNRFGPLTASGSGLWRTNTPMREGAQYVVFRDLAVLAEAPVEIEAAPAPGGVAVLNGLQIFSRGTSPPKPLVAPAALAAPRLLDPRLTNLLFHEIRYEGRLSDSEARFAVTVLAESLVTNEVSAPLFDGDAVLLTQALPPGARITTRGKESQLHLETAGFYTLSFEMAVKIQRTEPWNEIRLAGPAAALASVSATSQVAGVDLQFVNGAQLPRPGGGITGAIGADRLLALRWQSRAAEVARKPLLTVDTTVRALVKPAGVEYTTTLRYEILQAPAPRLALDLPAGQTLTRLQGSQIRDWQARPEGAGQRLTVEFIKPVEKSCELTLISEQALPAGTAPVTFAAPEPLEAQRESGVISVAAEEVLVEIVSAAGVRQANAPAGALTAYRFNGRPFTLTAAVRRLEPVLSVNDRVTVRVEEARVTAMHALGLNVEKAGLYALDLVPQAGFAVVEVKGEGVDDWQAAPGGKGIRVSFSSRVFGARTLEVLLEQAQPKRGAPLQILPLGVPAAARVTAQIGAASPAGIRLKTAESTGLREIPVNSLGARSDELLAFQADTPQWTLALEAEQLKPRVVSEVFNLVTVGDGLAGGSATIRFGILNQGAQEFQVAVPGHWRNVEFTGANIRRKEHAPLDGTNGAVLWTLALQDKAWGGYTLVVTYDYPFDPKGARLDLAGAHTPGVERETGSLGVMTAASLKLDPEPATGPLRRVDEADLSESDRQLCTRPLLLAYKYTAPEFSHGARVTRFEEQAVLDAVADRTELVTVLTEEGQMLTQASFMVKNNEKQSQQFRLPPGAQLWTTFVNGQPAKPERDGDLVMAPLPRGLERDQALAVDIVYAQKLTLRGGWFAQTIELLAPVTDIPNTYAEWQLFAPMSQHLSAFDGNMTAARGSTYELRDAADEFVKFYGWLLDRYRFELAVCLGLGFLVVLGVAAARRGFRLVVQIGVVFLILTILAGMLLPSLARAKAKAQRVNSVSNLKQIGLAASIWAADNGNRYPQSFEQMKAELGGYERVIRDTLSGQPFVWIGAGKDASSPQAILAYSPVDMNGRAVLFADGSAQQMTAAQFDEALRVDAALSQKTPGQKPQELKAVKAPAAPVIAAGMGGPAMTTNYTAMPRGAAVAQAASEPQAATAMAAGVRSLRIDIPRAGRQFSFTKVLNVRREPLSIRASIQPVQRYRQLLMAGQVGAFLLGLGLLWRAWQPGWRSGFWMSAGAVLAAAGVGSLLMLGRALGSALIAAPPLLLMLAVLWVVARKWRRRSASGPSEGAAAAAALALALFVLPSRAAPAPEPPMPQATILSAVYTGVLQEKAARFDARITVAAGATNQVVPLFADDIAIQEFKGPPESRLIREGGRTGIYLAGRGPVTLEFKLVARLGGDVTKRTLAFAIPPALATRVEAVLEEAGAEVECPGAVWLKRSEAGAQTRVEALLGAAERLEMSWTPRVKRAAEIAATVFCNNTALATFGGGVLNLRCVFDYTVTQGELRQARLRLPPGHRLLRVEAEFLRVWEIKPDPAGDILVADLLKPVSPAWKLSIETEKLLEKAPASARVELPRPLDVKRETGLVGLRDGEELLLTIETAGELQRVDAEEFLRALPSAKAGLVSAFRFLGGGFTLSVRAEAVTPRIESAGRDEFRLGTEFVSLTSQITSTIKRAGVFALRAALPLEWRLDGVDGPGVAQWTERTNAGLRVLEVALKERVLGAHSLRLRLFKALKDPAAPVVLAGVTPLDCAKFTGFVTVSSEAGLGLKVAQTEGLTEVPYAATGAGRAAGGALAWKLVAGEQPAAPWKLVIATEAVEAWVRAETLSVFTVAETLVSARAVVRYDIANAPVKELRLRVPAAARNVEITGPNIRRRDQAGTDWRLELQARVQGEHAVSVTWEQPKESSTRQVELAGVEALGAERESGFLVVAAKPPLQVAEKGVSGLLNRIDVRELPAWAGAPGEQAVLAYRYPRPGARLQLEARRFDEAEVLQALADSAQFTTVVADDGQMITHASLTLRNHGRQHLEVELPPGATNWSAFVANEPVRPGKRGPSRLLLPLDRSGAGEAVKVELTYVSEGRFPRRHGEVALASPKFDVPMKHTRWDVYLPPDYDYTQFEGGMTRASAEEAPMAEAFSLSQYTRQESEMAAEQKRNLKLELSNAKMELAGGKTREAITRYNRARKPSSQAADYDDSNELRQIASDVKRAQSSNLVLAQNNWAMANAARLGGDARQPGAQAAQIPMDAQQQDKGGAQQRAQAGLNADLEIAGQQWERLEAAQQVATHKTPPLRVNLPTRGLRYSFTQVLQTELNKPLVLRFHAENTRLPSWSARLGLFGGAFLGLWILMSALLRRRPA